MSSYFSLFSMVSIRKAHGPEPVVAGEHRRGGVPHPSVVEVRRAVRERHDEGRKGLPGAWAQPFGPLHAVGDEDLPLVQVAGVLDRVFVAFHQVLVADLADDGDPDVFHGRVSFGVFPWPDGASSRAGGAGRHLRPAEHPPGVGRRRGGDLLRVEPLDFGDLVADVAHVGRFVAPAPVGNGCQVGAVGLQHDVAQAPFRARFPPGGSS